MESKSTFFICINKFLHCDFPPKKKKVDPNFLNSEFLDPFSIALVT